MAKKTIKPAPFLYPMPITIIGTKIDNKPNYMTESFNGIFTFNPTKIGVSVNKKKSTNKAIHYNKEFSINIPNKKIIVETDFVGKNVKKEKKADVFTSFYGELKNAPMIVETPINAECKLVKSVDLGDFDLYIGEVIKIYVEETALTNGIPNIEKTDPMFLTFPDNLYWSLGENIGEAWKIGSNLTIKE